MKSRMFPPTTSRSDAAPAVTDQQQGATTLADSPLLDASFSQTFSPVGSLATPSVAQQTAQDIAGRHGGMTRIGQTTLTVEVVAA